MNLVNIIFNHKVEALLTVLILIIIIENDNIKADEGTSSKPKPSYKVELAFECRNLPQKDIMSKSDPMIVAFEQIPETMEWNELKKTEVVKNKHKTDFLKQLVVTYKFHEIQQLKFVVYDSDSNSSKLKKHDGWVEITLAYLVTHRKSTLRLKDKNDKETDAELIITASELGEDPSIVILNMVGFNFQTKSACMFYSEPFLEISKLADTENYVRIRTTNVLETKSYHNNIIGLVWEIIIPVWQLCNGNYERDLKFVFWYRHKYCSPSYIGEFHTNLNDLTNSFNTSLELSTTLTFDVIDDKKKRKNDEYTNSGNLQVKNLRLERDITFIDYIQSKTEINCTVAIDFTISNGDPRNERSLHHIKPGNDKFLNSYEQAILSVVPIIEEYDTDKKFLVLGFGGDIGNGTTHNFNVNSNELECVRTSGVLEAYRKRLESVTLSFPTKFTSIIERVIDMAKTFENGKKYFILLILTDGVIDDMDSTKLAITAASYLPISIIIVGIGDKTKFDMMIELDADMKPLLNQRNERVRDIVQFVPFNRYPDFDRRGVNSKLSQDVLAEIPKQFLDYMKSKNILPTNRNLPDNYLTAILDVGGMEI